MSGRKSTKPAPKKTSSKIKAMLFGDKEIDNKNFIKAFGASCDITDKTEIYEMTKLIKDIQYPIEFNVMTNTDEKMIDKVNQSHCIFILFDMMERESFDNLLDKWLIWLRDDCLYNRTVYMLGDYQLDENIDEDVSHEVFLVTSDDEVQEVIACSDLKVKFIKIGAFKKEEKYKEIDNIFPTINTVIQSKAVVEENQGGSLHKKDCLIF